MPIALQKTVPFLLVPVGMSHRGSASSLDVNSYRANETNPLRRLPPLAYGAAALISSSLPYAIRASYVGDAIGKIISSGAAFVGLTTLIASILPEAGFDYFYGDGKPPGNGTGVQEKRGGLRIEDFLKMCGVPPALQRKVSAHSGLAGLN